MSDIQKILIGIAAQMHEGLIEASDLLRISLMLNGIPEYYHKDAVRAAFEVQDEEDKDAE